MTRQDAESSSFDRRAAGDYDVMVDWQARLAREIPFFEEEFARVGARTVLDVGCGTGQHAIRFAQAGLSVTAVDPSEDMLARARENIEAAGVDVKLLVGGFGSLRDVAPGPYDAVVSTGNAFIHVEGRRGAREALEDIAAVTRSGGLVVLHFLNHTRLLSRRPTTMATRYRVAGEVERVYTRLLRYDDDGIGMEFITLERRPGQDWTVSSRTTKHAILEPHTVRSLLQQAGFSDIALYGAHDRRPFEPLESESVVMTGMRD